MAEGNVVLWNQGLVEKAARDRGRRGQRLAGRRRALRERPANCRPNAPPRRV